MCEDSGVLKNNVSRLSEPTAVRHVLEKLWRNPESESKKGLHWQLFGGINFN